MADFLAKSRDLLRNVQNWPVARQLAEAGLGREAMSQHTASIHSRIRDADKTVSVCPFCAVGCSVFVYTRNGHIVDIEGNPASPINGGTLCPKGADSFQQVVNPARITKVLYRAPYGDRWEERPLDWAMDRIAHLVKETRDESFVEAMDGMPVNHTTAIASLGGATLDNEENYLIKKLYSGGLGIVWIENQARI